MNEIAKKALERTTNTLKRGEADSHFSCVFNKRKMEFITSYHNLSKEEVLSMIDLLIGISNVNLNDIEEIFKTEK